MRRLASCRARPLVKGRLALVALALALLAQVVPPPLADAGSYADLPSALAARRAWLTQPEIAAVYEAEGTEAALRLYGLPTSRPERRGPFVAQRFQRAVLQLWVEPVAGAPE